MARAIDGDAVLDRYYAEFEKQAIYDGSQDRDWLMRCIEEAPTLTPQNEWVSVEERLPEVGQEVLIYWRNTSQKAEHFELTHYDGDHWFLLDNVKRPWIVVVAWMTLPAPPNRRPPERQEDAK